MSAGSNDDYEYDEVEKLIDDGEDSSDNTLPCYVRFKSLITGAGVIIFFFAGTLVEMYTEGWDLLTAAYVNTQIVTTVGYGDITAQSDATRLFMTFFVFWCVIFIATVFNEVSGLILAREAKAVTDRLRRIETQDDGQSTFERYHINSLFVSVAVFLLFALGGTLFFATYEKCSCSYGLTQANNYANCTDTGTAPNCATEGGTKNFVQAFYMSVITMTTVGFGDFTPLSKLGRALGIPWMVLGVLASGNLVAAISTTMHALTKVAEKKVSKVELVKIAGTKATLTRTEFLQYALMKHALVDQAHVDAIDAIYFSMDANKDGNVSVAEIERAFPDEDN